MDIIKAGVYMAVYLFCVMIAYFCISPFMSTFFDSMDDAEVGEATAHLDYVIPIAKGAFTIFIALWAAVAPTWFICWVMRREPDWSQYQR